MANQEHLDILKQEVKVWNAWRQEFPDIRPDLSEANLVGTDLRRANLHKSDLSRANLHKTNLSDADFSGAMLWDADLTGANVCRANLSGANLRHAILYRADLKRANLMNVDLNGANLMEANLSGADLSRANLSRANLMGVNLGIYVEATLGGGLPFKTMLIDADLREAFLESANIYGASLDGSIFSKTSIGNTVFVNVDLSRVIGLEAVHHTWPSEISISSIYLSGGNIPDMFLKGAGVDDTFITYVRSLVGRPIEYYSCFISYSSKDQAFAERLYADLQSNNVRCWYAPEDLKWGAHIRTGIDEAIRLHDKLLLILSRHSVASGWVEREVKTALAKEKKEKRTVLFPVRLDGAVFDCPFEWATEIRHERNIGDFTRWKNHDDYQKAFTRLLRDLKAEPPSRL